MSGTIMGACFDLLKYYSGGEGVTGNLKNHTLFRGTYLYISYIGMCRGIGYGFLGSPSINRVSILSLIGIMIPM